MPRDVLPTWRLDRAVPGRPGLAPLADGTPVCAVMGDSHAALFAHAGGARPGQGDLRHGLVDHVPRRRHAGRRRRPCLTIAWDDGAPAHAFEGNIRSSGATLTWLAECSETTPEELAATAADDAGGVHLVPAFGGLGAPWWDDEAVGLLSGLTSPPACRSWPARRSSRSPSRSRTWWRRSRARPGGSTTLLADGGPTANATLMQLQADTSGRGVARSLAAELSGLGVAHLAGRAAGVWTQEELEALSARARPTNRARTPARAARADRRLARRRGPRTSPGGDRTCLDLSPRPSS